MQHGQKNPAHHFTELSMSTAKESSRWVPAQGQGEEGVTPELPKRQGSTPTLSSGMCRGLLPRVAATRAGRGSAPHRTEAAVSRATRKDGSDIVSWGRTSLTLKSLLHLMAFEWPIHHYKGATHQNLFHSLQIDTPTRTKKLWQRCNSNHMRNCISIITSIFKMF